MLLEFMTKYEPVWLAMILLISVSFEAYTAYTVKREFDYDENKDLEKKQKRTRVTKKVTIQAGGGSVTEESSDTTEPIQEEKK